jgi:hypothetical protein
VFRSDAPTYHQQLRAANPQAGDEDLQDELIEACEKLAGVKLS